MSDWLQRCCWEASVYAELSKQMLMESSAAGCFQSFLVVRSGLTQRPVEFGCRLQRYSQTKVFVFIVCYGKHIYHVILYYIPWSWKDVSQKTIENAIFTRLFELHRCSFRRRVKKLFELRSVPCRRA